VTREASGVVSGVFRGRAVVRPPPPPLWRGVYWRRSGTAPPFP
jgi:hypothetical protein